MSEVKPEEEWNSKCKSSSRTRPILVGQYPSSLSPSVLNSPPPLVNEITACENHSNNNKDNNNDPTPTSTIKDNTLIGVKDELNSATNTCSSSPLKFSQSRTPDTKNIKSLSIKNGRLGKESGIPVGIAVAWQRLVTSASNTLSTTDTTISCCAGTAEAEKSTRMASPNNNKGKMLNPSCSSPNRPLSASSAPGAIPPTKDHRGDTKNNKTSQSKLSDLKNRPASVNSIPIVHHQQQHHGMSSLQPNLTAIMKQQQQYALSGLSSPYTDWSAAGLNVNVPHLPHNYDNAAYIQQLSLHHQQLQHLQLSHNSHYGNQQLAHGGYVYGGYSPETLQKYEQYLQQSEIHRHHQELQYHHQLHQHQQQQLQQEYELRRAATPRINIPSPSPTLHSSQSLWPPEFFHQNSSTALSPKSLTSTPSPVQDSTSTSHYLLPPTTTTTTTSGNSGGRRSTTPTTTNCSTTTTSCVVSSPILPPKKSVSASWKEVKITPVPKKLKSYDKVESPIGLDVSKLEEEVRVEDKRTLGGKKHDFTRLESLIEKRVSVPLLNQQQQQQNAEEQQQQDSEQKYPVVVDMKKKYFDNNKNEKSYSEKLYGDYRDNEEEEETIYAQPCASTDSKSPQIEIKNEVNRCDEVDGVCKQVPETKLSLPVVETQSKLLENSIPPPPSTLIATCSSDTTENDLEKTVSLMKMKRNDKKALNSVDTQDKDKHQGRSLHKSVNKWDNNNGQRKLHDFHTMKTKCIYDGDSGRIDDKESASDNDNSVTNFIHDSTPSKLNRDIISNNCSPPPPTQNINVKKMDKITENIKQEVEPLENSIYCGSNILLYNKSNKKTLQVFSNEEKSDGNQSPAAGTSSKKKLMENMNDKSSSSSPSVNINREFGAQDMTSGKMMGKSRPVSCAENEIFRQQQQVQHIPAGSNSSKTTTTKCDNDIKVRAGSCLNTSNSLTYSAISDNSSLVYSRSTIKKEEIKKQESQLTDVYHPHQYDIGNRSYQLLNVPLPPLSVDRKLIFNKAENQQNHSDTIDKNRLLEHNNSLLSQRFQQHHFLPIEDENNHLNLLATVAQEFGNEIGSGSLNVKTGQQQHHVLDTYEFVEDVQEKIESFSQTQLALNTFRPSKIKTKLKYIPSSSPPTSTTTTSTSTLTPVMPTTDTTGQPPIVLKIPHITPSDRLGKNKKSPPKSAKKSKKGDGQLTGGLITEEQQQSQKPKKKLSTPKKREPKIGKEKVVRGSRKKVVGLTKMAIISEASFISDNNNDKVSTSTGGDDHVIKVKRKYKKQTVPNVSGVVERQQQIVESKEHGEEGMPLNLEKKKSTSDVMNKGNRSSLGSNLQLQNQSKDDKPIELVLSQVQKIPGDKPSSKKKDKSLSKFSSSSTVSTIREKSKKNKLLLMDDDKLIMGGLQEGQSTIKMIKSTTKKKPSQKKPNALSQDLTLQNKKINRNKNKKEKTTKILANTFNLNTTTTTKKQKQKKNPIDNSYLINNTTGTHNSLIKPNILFKSDDNDMTALRIEDCQLFSPTPSSTTSNVENDFIVSNPTYAVTAIKTNDIDESSTLSSPITTKFSSSSVDHSFCLTNDVHHPPAVTHPIQKDKRKSKPSKLTPMNVNSVTTYSSESTTTTPTTTIVNNQESEQELFHVKSQLKSFVHFSPRKSKVTTKSHQQQQYHIKPCLKAEPILRTATSPERDFISDEEKDVGIENIDLMSSSTKIYSTLESSSVSSRRISLDKIHSENKSITINEDHDLKHYGVMIKHKENGTISLSTTDKNIESSPNESMEVIKHQDGQDEPCKNADDKVVIESVAEMLDDMRILTEIQGLFYTGKLNALQPPDVYGVTLDNERGAPPHLIFSAEEVLEKCIREVKPAILVTGLRICAYWSPQYSGLYPGKVSWDYIPTGDPHNELIPIEFDDGDTGVIKLAEIRLLASDHPIREYDPNPLLTLEKKHRKRRHSSATGSQSGCSGDHEDADCGEPYCAKVGKFVDSEEKHHSSHLLYWSWKGLGYKKPRSKKDRNKEFFDGIQRGDEIVNVGDSALFISSGNERPFIGRVEKFWEKKGQKVVSIRWFYHPEEVKTNNRRLQGLKYAGALFESPHIDENDVQTIARKCEVLPFKEFKERYKESSTESSPDEKKNEAASRSKRLNNSEEKSEFKEKVGCLKWSKNNTSSQKGVYYYVAGFYDPYTYNLQLKDLK